MEFLCECVPAKIEFLKKAFPEVKFIFNDMRDLTGEKAHDAVSNRLQDIPDAARPSLI